MKKIDKLEKLCSMDLVKFNAAKFKCMCCGKIFSGAELINYNENSSPQWGWADGCFPCCERLSEFHRDDLDDIPGEETSSICVRDLSQCLLEGE